MNIKGRLVTLRAMTKSDMNMICDMFNDPELENLVVGWAFPLSLEQQEVWFEKNMNDSKNFRFVIDVPDDGAVGIVTLINVDWKNRCAEQGIKLVNKGNRAKGIGTDTVMAIMRYAFEELGLHRLDATIFDENIASRGLYKKCGWKEEGVKKSCIFKHGKWRDLVIMGILDSDYYETVERLKYWED